MPTPLCMVCQHLTCTNYSLSKILSLTWFCLHFVILQQVSDSVTSTGFPFTTEYTNQSRALRSSTQQLLHVPYMSADFGRRVLSYSSPATQNSIPISIKNCSSLNSFKHNLKLKVSLYSPAHKQLTHSVWQPSDCPRLLFMLNA